MEVILGKQAKSCRTSCVSHVTDSISLDHMINVISKLIHFVRQTHTQKNQNFKRSYSVSSFFFLNEFCVFWEQS